MSGDPGVDGLVDGIVEEITATLSQVRDFTVIARNSAYTYKGRAVDVRDIARELNVRYVLEGSLRKAGDRVRVTAQLIDASSGAHIWADRYDGAVGNLFSSRCCSQPSPVAGPAAGQIQQLLSNDHPAALRVDGPAAAAGPPNRRGEPGHRVHLCRLQELHDVGRRPELGVQSLAGRFLEHGQHRPPAATAASTRPTSLAASSPGSA